MEKCSFKNRVHISTVHRWLLSREEEHLVIVDEASMLDAELTKALLERVGCGTRLVLIGDPNQLPAVEPGAFFSDLSGLAGHTARLKKVQRTDSKELLDLAHTIRQGDGEGVLSHLDRGKDVAWKEESDLLGYAEAEFQKGSSFRLLAPFREGRFGVLSLNQELHRRFKGRGVPIPIVITRNAEALNLYNGETGVIMKDEAHFQGRRLPVCMLPEYELAYCLTVHKSQGSEFEKVLFVLDRAPPIDGRSLFYTAATRASKTFEVCGGREEVKNVVECSSKRLSSLMERMGR